jgi:hypothetical protein
VAELCLADPTLAVRSRVSIVTTGPGTTAGQAREETMTNVMRRPRALLASLAAGLAAVLALALVLVSAPAGAAASTRTVAEATLHANTKVVVTATKASADHGAPTATTRLAVYQRSASGDWRLLGQRVIGKAGGWFWYVLTDRGSVCAFNLREAPTLRIDVSLLYSPSIGCSPVYHYHLHNSQLVSG